MTGYSPYARFGDMRRRIVILQRSDAQSLSGAMIPSWTAFATVWAEIKPATGRELMMAQQVGATVSHAIRMRWLTGVLPSMRVQYGERYFDINAVLNIEEMNRQLQLLCTERVGQD